MRNGVIQDRRVNDTDKLKKRLHTLKLYQSGRGKSLLSSNKRLSALADKARIVLTKSMDKFLFRLCIVLKFQSRQIPSAPDLLIRPTSCQRIPPPISRIYSKSF